MQEAAYNDRIITVYCRLNLKYTMEHNLQTIHEQEIEAYLIELRGQKVLLDRDVAMLYGVETKRVNEAVKNNPERFPEGYIIQLNDKEIQYLRSKFSTANLSSKIRAVPKAFTEKGLYMLATILKSPRAVATTLAIIESFAHLRELTRNMALLSAEPDEDKQKGLMRRSGELLNDLLAVDEEGDITETESSIELNLYALKMKRTVKKMKKK